MNCRCDNCGSNNIVPVPIVHISTRETVDTCRPCANAMVRAMPTAWAILPKGN